MTARPPRTKEPTKIQREREINFIYFVDSSKTHTVKLRLSVFRYYVAGVAFFIVGSLSAFYFLYKIEDDRQSTLSELRQSQATIFDYQTRHDGVYEKAYPSASRQISTTITMQPEAAAQETPTATPFKSTQILEPKSEQKSEPVQVSGVVFEGEIKLKFIEEPQLEGSQRTISIESPSVVLEKRSIHFKFDMRNAESKRRAEGKLSIVAAFEDDSGRRSYVTEPRSIRVASDGKVANPERGVRYNIATFYHRDFKLPVPSSMKSQQLVEVLLILMDKSGPEITEYRAPVNAKLALSN